MGSTESKAFTGLPIPGAATLLATLVIFYTEMWEKIPVKNYFILFFVFSLAVLMVSTLRFHGAQELVFRRRKPFWILVAFVVVLVVIIMHPEIALFVFAMIYLVSGIIENIVLFARKKKHVQKAGKP